MNIIDHELKRHELWQEELAKKKKADILLVCWGSLRAFDFSWQLLLSYTKSAQSNFSESSGNIIVDIKKNLSEKFESIEEMM